MRDPVAVRRTVVDPAELEQSFQFLAQLYLPPGIFRSVRRNADGDPVSHLRAPDGSWCEISREPDIDGRHAVREAGSTALWANVETAWSRWRELGAPAWHEFGLTATATEHHIWLRDPQDGPRWPLPTSGASVQESMP